ELCTLSHFELSKYRNYLYKKHYNIDFEKPLGNRPALWRHFFSLRGEKKRPLPKKPTRGEEMSPRSLGEKIGALRSPREKKCHFFSSRSLDNVIEAYSPTSPRLLLPVCDGSRSSRESDTGSLGYPFSSPSSSFSLD
ncbi:hypothetical protein GW17_00019595, partial [Ensete ventricosum]